MNPRFSISILAYENLSLTRKCIESVMTSGGDFELILTDNGCQDGTAEYFDTLARSHANIRVVHNNRNLGFIEPNRRAFRLAAGKFLILLNDDTLVPKNWLDLLAAPFAVDPKCALTGPDGGCSQLRADFHGERGNRFEYLEGSMLCMDREKVARAEPDLFPPELDGAYGEDSYLSLRMRELGYTLHRVFLPFTHYRCATSAMVPQCREWQAKNHAFLQKRFARYMIGHRFDWPIIVKRNAAWGDVLLTTPIIRALKWKFPLSPISVETICPRVFDGNPDVQYVSHNIQEQAGAMLVNLNGISEMKPAQHVLKSYADCAGVTLAAGEDVCRMYPNGGDVEWAKRTVPVGERWLALHMGPTLWPHKNWTREKWQTVIDGLHAEGWRLVAVGNAGLTVSGIDNDLREKTTVAQLAALLGEVSLFIGLDSFPIHVAQAMGTPVIGLFGITDPDLLLTGGSAKLCIRSDLNHPGTGLRHHKPGMTRVECREGNPMDTIMPDQILTAARTFAQPSHP